MAEVLPSELVSSVMAKLYDVLTNGDDTVPQSEDNFFSWATPGIPAEVEDFDFLTQGLTGVVKPKAVDDLSGTPEGTAEGGETPPASETEVTPALLDQLRAEDTNRMYLQAENFARLVDFVPDVTQAANNQFARLTVLNNEGTLSEIYQRTLQMSQVMKSELPAETKKKIEELRGLLTTTTTKKDLIDGSESQVSEPSELTKAYFEKMAAYESAVLEYNTHRIDALSATNSRAIHFWSVNANTLRNKVKAAMSDWVSNGYKNDYEKIAAFIDQVEQRDLSLLKQAYRDDLEKARLTGLASGSDFFYTSATPGNFARSSGWTEFTFSSGDIAHHTSTAYSTKRWKAEASGGFLGIFGASGGGGSSSSEETYNSNFNIDTFTLQFKIAQVPLVRPWFKPSFLLSKTWRFDEGNPDVKGDMLSDGGAPPKGIMPAYPTAAIFIRDLTLRLSHSEGFHTFVEKHARSSAEGGGWARFGPINLGGSYERATSSGSTQRDHGHTWDNQGMNVPGLQLIGFKCHILPKSPDPLSSITSWI